jgi:hypothetical protein
MDAALNCGASGYSSVSYGKARTGRNPRTGQDVKISKKRLPFFKASKEMRDRLNRDEPPRLIGRADQVQLSNTTMGMGEVQSEVDLKKEPEFRRVPEV